MNGTPNAERLHIGFFGLRNAGKSSLCNAVTGQPLSVVSPVAGTTTDPVKKAMELLPLGPVVIVDTPGLDDEGELGALRVKRAEAALAQTDIAVLVTATEALTPLEAELLAEIEKRGLPYLIAHNKADLLYTQTSTSEHDIYVSALTGEGINELKDRLAALGAAKQNTKRIIGDKLQAGDTVVLVIPIDDAAPKGRVILPQQQTLRDILDAHASALCCQPAELAALLKTVTPRMIITDSQAFWEVSAIVPEHIELTSFSILFARYKGELAKLVRGAKTLAALREGDKVLIAEGCTHHRQCGDIGTEKLPRWIEAYCGAKPEFTFSSGTDFPDGDFKLIVHCGGCMLTETEMRRRLQTDVPVVNYGVAIAEMNGILDRTLTPFKEELDA